MKLPYHCGVFIDRETQFVRLCIAWNRVGSRDLGFYLARNGSDYEFMFFSAEYDNKGQLRRFLVKEGPLFENSFWDGERLGDDTNQVQIRQMDMEHLDILLHAVVVDWFESAHSQEAAKLLKQYIGCGVAEKIDSKRVVTGHLPLQIPAGKMPDFWSGIVELDGGLTGLHFSFNSTESRLAHTSYPLLIEKFKLFLELV